MAERKAVSRLYLIIFFKYQKFFSSYTTQFVNYSNSSFMNNCISMISSTFEQFKVVTSCYHFQYCINQQSFLHQILILSLFQIRTQQCILKCFLEITRKCKLVCPGKLTFTVLSLTAPECWHWRPISAKQTPSDQWK